MKPKPMLFVGAASLVLAAIVLGLPAVAKSSVLSKSFRRGTAIYHKFLAARLVYVGEDLGEESPRRPPYGRVSVKHNRQGHADNQRLDIAMGRLERDATYMLLALVGDDTNYVHVADFDTSRRGTARILYRQIGSSRGRGLGHAKHALPEILSPVSGVREIAVANASTQLVLRAQLSLPSRLHYLIKRNLDNDGLDSDAQGAVYIKANHRKTSFRLYAAGLDENATYRLVLNDDPEWYAEAGASEWGWLTFKSWPVEPAEVLFVEHLAVWNAESNSVLSATLR